MGKYVRLPKPIYDVKPFVYAIAGFAVALMPFDPVIKLTGLMFGTIGFGYIMNRLETPLHDRD